MSPDNKIGMDIHEARERIQDEQWIIVDIRDEVSYKEGHIKGAKLLNSNNLKYFIGVTQKSSRIMCYCYHGISSKEAALFLKKQGFNNVRHIEGGFEAWKGSYAYDIEDQ